MFIAATVCAASATAHHWKHHHPGCNTDKCDARIDRAWGRIHHWSGYQTGTVESGPISALEACIIRKESGGDPNAVYGIHSGIGQWEQSRWEEDGGLRYASTPTGASYAEQEKVLRGEGEAGMIEQQGKYDGCS